jgi:KDO2-lipid IV(A) lauroyltransferase
MRRPDPLTRRSLLLPFRFAARLAPRICQRWGSYHGALLAAFLMRRSRASVEGNLRIITGIRSRNDLRRLATRAFRHYGQYLLDYMALPHLGREDPPWRVSLIEGGDLLEAAVRQNRGVVLVTPHLGHWELGGAFLAARGFEIAAATAPEPDPGILGLREAMRRRIGVRSLTLRAEDGAMGLLPLLGALREGRIVAMLADRSTIGSSTEVEFFGRRTPFPLGPALLGRASGAPVVPVYITICSDWSYKIAAENPIHVAQSSDRVRDLQEATQEVARRFQARIARHPDQWYNFFDFWPGGQSGRRA